MSVLDYLAYRQSVERMTNDELARALLAKGPVFGALADVIEVAAERLSPGIIERLGSGDLELVVEKTSDVLQ